MCFYFLCDLCLSALSRSWQIDVDCLVLFVALHVRTFDQGLDALLDHHRLGLEVRNLLNHLTHQVLMRHCLVGLHNLHDVRVALLLSLLLNTLFHLLVFFGWLARLLLVALHRNNNQAGLGMRELHVDLNLFVRRKLGLLDFFEQKFDVGLAKI